MYDTSQVLCMLLYRFLVLQFNIVVLLMRINTHVLLQLARSYSRIRLFILLYSLVDPPLELLLVRTPCKSDGVASQLKSHA